MVWPAPWEAYVPGPEVTMRCASGVLLRSVPSGCFTLFEHLSLLFLSGLREVFRWRRRGHPKRQEGVTSLGPLAAWCGKEELCFPGEEAG